MHSIQIDLRRFRVPGTDEVQFRFVNPIWAWVTAASDMLDAGHTIIFQPKTMLKEHSNERLFGAGVAFGDKIRYIFFTYDV